MKKVDGWKYNILKNYKNVPMSDIDIYESEPDIRWIYHKNNLVDDKNYILFNNKKVDLKMVMDFYKSNKKMIIKPNVNLRGMSNNFYILDSEEKVNTVLNKIKNYNNEIEFIGLPVYEGEYYFFHISVENRKISNLRAWQAIRDNNFSFELFYNTEFVDITPSTIIKLFQFSENLLDGFYCIEFIGHKIIDAHKRLSSQFYDLDADMFKAWNENDLSPIDDYVFNKKYSRVKRVFEDIKVNNVDFENIKKLVEYYPSVYSCNLCFDVGEYLSKNIQDSYSYRLFFVNGDKNLKEIDNFSDSVLKYILLN